MYVKILERMIGVLAVALLLGLSRVPCQGKELLSKELLSDWRTWQTKGCQLAEGKSGVEWRVNPGVTVAEVAFPLWDAAMAVVDEIELDVLCQDDQACIVAVVYADKPVKGQEAKKDLPLKKGRNICRIPLSYRGLEHEKSRLLLTLYNQADNMHIPASKVTQPLTMKGVRLNVRKSDILKFPQQEVARFSKDSQEQFRGEFARLVQHVQSALTEEDTIKALRNVYSWRRTFGWRHERIELEQLFAKHGDVVYGVNGGADKILRQDAFPGTKMGTAAVSLGRNETEGVQIALMSKRDLKNVTCKVSPLRRWDGRTLGHDQVRSYGVAYVKPPVPCYPSSYHSYIPDPLLADGELFNVDAWNYAPVWIDVKTLSSDKPGLYEGMVSFAENGRTFLTVPLQVSIWKFSLPDTPTFPVVFSTNGLEWSNRWAAVYGFSDAARKEARDCFMADEPNPKGLSPEARKVWDMFWQMKQMQEEHHIPLDNFYRSTNVPLPKWQRLMHRHDRTWFSLGYLGNHYLKKLKDVVADMRQEGSLGRAYVYGYDEIRRQAQFDDLKKCFGEVKKAYPELKTMATCLDYTCGERSGVKDELDIWVFPPPNYMSNRRYFPGARAKGQQVWWYPCNWPFPPAPNFLLENLASATRLFMGFMPWKWDVDGCLYYCTDMWKVYEQNSCYLNKWSSDTAGIQRCLTKDAYPWQNTWELETQGKKTWSTLWQWGHVKQKAPRPIMISTEARILEFAKGEKTECHLDVTFKYADKKGSEVVTVPLGDSPHDWQVFKRTFQPKHPVHIFSYSYQLRSPKAKIQVRNSKLYSPDHLRDSYPDIRDRLKGSPVMTGQYPNFLQSTGDGTMLLPGEKGPLVCLRMKFIRDGLEDYEYLHLLNQAVQAVEKGGQEPRKGWLVAAKACLQVSDKLCKSLYTYTPHGKDVLDQRAVIGCLLDEFSK